jgi:membrane protease YdiL (CAAX protease family)
VVTRLRDRADGTAARATAWVAGLVLASGLPLELASPGAASIVAGMATTGVLLLATVVRAWAAARAALLVYAAISTGGWASLLVTMVPPVGQWLAAAPVAVAFLVVNGVKVISVALAALVVRRWGTSGLYLRPGDPRALAGPRRWGLRWAVAGPVTIAATLVLFATGVPAGSTGRVAPWLPVIALGALVNASAEEFLYRHAAIRALRESMGVTPAVLLTSAMFGLAHLTGNPGGLSGVLYTTVFGLICAHAMTRTQGFGWNLPIHFFGDVGVCVTLVALAN